MPSRLLPSELNLEREKMLSPSEFTVGKVNSAKPLSLIQPTNSYEETLLVGQSDEATVAVFLSGPYKATLFETKENTAFGGIIIPNVQIEIDETSVVNLTRNDVPLLAVVRAGTRLEVLARSNQGFMDPKSVALYDNLESAGGFKAAFTRWQVVVGEGENKRIIWTQHDDPDD